MSDHPLHYAAPPPHPHSHYAVAYQHPPHAPPPLMHPQPVAYAQAAVAGAVHVSPDAPYAHPHHPYPYAHAAPAAHAPPRHEYGLVSAEPAGVRRPPSVLKASRMTSQFVGVHRSGKKRKPWTAACYWQGKQHHLGYYPTEDEAAVVYDKFVRDKSLDRRVNFPEDGDKSAAQAKASSRSARGVASKFTGVHHSRSNPMRPWRASCMSKRKHHHLGIFQTEEEAALAYDAFVIEQDLHRDLNFPHLRHVLQAGVASGNPALALALATQPGATALMPGMGAAMGAAMGMGGQPQAVVCGLVQPGQRSFAPTAVPLMPPAPMHPMNGGAAPLAMGTAGTGGGAPLVPHSGSGGMLAGMPTAATPLHVLSAGLGLPPTVSLPGPPPPLPPASQPGMPGGNHFHACSNQQLAGMLGLVNLPSSSTADLTAAISGVPLPGHQ